MHTPGTKRTTYRSFRDRDTSPVVFREIEKEHRTRKPLTTGLEPYAGEWTQALAAHLLKRCTFGVRSNEIEQLVSLGLEGAVDLLSTTNPNNTLPVNNYAHIVEDPHVSPGESWVGSAHGEEAEFLRIFSLKQWILKGFMNGGNTLHHKMVLFWHNIIPTQFFLIELANLSYAYFKILDTNAFGNFKEIIKQITVDPSMLLYLNGAFNSKEAPDENYARELQELFTVGKGPGSQYTEQDVYEAARILTGWSIDIDAVIDGEAKSYFEPAKHDVGDKTFSSFYGNRVISGKSGEDGQQETDELISMILETNEAAQYICRRLYNFFVYHEIDAQVESDIIQPLATLFRSNNYDILPVIKTLLLSEHFYDQANVGAYIKSPLDHTLGLLRAFDYTLSEDLEESFDFMNLFYFIMHEAGMGVGDPPSVSGWQAYYQQPSYDKIWINSDTIIKRIQVQDYLIYELLDIPGFVSHFANPADPNELVRESNLLLHGIPLADGVLDDLKSNLLAGQQLDSYWTTAWTLYENNPDDQEYRSTVENRLKALFRQFLQLSEFQLM